MALLCPYHLSHYFLKLVSFCAAKLYKSKTQNNCSAGSVRLSAHAEVLPASYIQIRCVAAYHIMFATHPYIRGHGNAHTCQLNVKPALYKGFALTPSPSPSGRGEQEIQFPFSLREKGLGDEGEGFCTTLAVYSF